MKIIEKKIKPEYYNAVIMKKKTFELRKDEDCIAAGDILVLREWDDERETYTGRSVKVKAKYVLRNVEKYGLMRGYCIIGF